MGGNRIDNRDSYRTNDLILVGMYRISGSDIRPFFTIRFRFRPKCWTAQDIATGYFTVSITHWDLHASYATWCTSSACRTVDQRSHYPIPVTVGYASGNPATSGCVWISKIWIRRIPKFWQRTLALQVSPSCKTLEHVNVNYELLAPPLRRSIEIIFIRNNVQRIKNRKKCRANNTKYIYIHIHTAPHK